jgi:hypothetical protein
LASISTRCISLKILRVSCLERQRPLPSLSFLHYLFARLLNLEELELSNLELTQPITCSAPQLRILKLGISFVNGIFLTTLGMMCPRLHWLDLPFNSLEHINSTSFSSFRNLDSLFITMCEIDSSNLWTSILPVSKKLCTIDLAGTSASRSVEDLQKLILNSDNLINLRLWNLTLNDDFLVKLKQQIERINIQSVEINNKKLIHLTLSRKEMYDQQLINSFGNIGMACLSFIWPNLISLNVSGSNLTDVGIKR